MGVRGVVVRIVTVSACCLSLFGCKDRAGEKAKAEAAEARIALSKVRAELNRANGRIAELNEELQAVAQSRDELDLQVGQLIEQRDKALTLAQNSKAVTEKLMAHSSEQSRSTADFEAQIRQLNITIEQHKTTIAQQQAYIEELQKVILEFQPGEQPQQQDDGAEPMEPQPAEPEEPEEPEEPAEE
ncbi:MAG: hypothetical protein JSU94_01920 [Phycisphaerales bacterium]|nr:MAG: hypothetical protein JSU94_01920 [Phycisphaerales bacterium]